MRIGWILFVTLALPCLAACGGSFSSGSEDGGEDAYDDNPGIYIDGTSPDGTAADGAGMDATAHDGAGHDAGDGSVGDSPSGDAGEASTQDSGPPTCQGGTLDCGGVCVPSDVKNCGKCGHDCTNLAHVPGPTSCTGATCAFPASSCAPGWADCDGVPDNGCETDITQTAHCGACGTTCPSNLPVCASSGSSYACASGCPVATPTLCSGACVDTTSNPGDCKTCGNTCPGVPNGQPACASSACTFSCNTGYTKCPTASPTACVDTTSDINNCNGCGNVCSTSPPNGHPACANSQCTFACNPGYLACSAACIATQPPPGVMVSLVGAGSNCGGLGTPCNSIGYAITLAQAQGYAFVVVDKGTYTEQVTVPAGITVQGGWSYNSVGGTWTHLCPQDPASAVISAPAGADRAVVATGGTLDTLTVENNNTAATGQTLYGVFAQSGAVTLTNVRVLVAAGGTGATGLPGGAGMAATGTCGTTAGSGAAGSTGSPGGPGAQGSYSAAGFVAADGTKGGTGGQGSIGTIASPPGSSPDPLPACCDNDGCGSCGAGITASPASVGCGGYGAGGGYGGKGGGASIGIFASQGVTVTNASVAVQTGTGGTGGTGGPSGNQGAGSPGVNGANDSYVGACAISPPGCHPGGGICGCSAKSNVVVKGGVAGLPGGPGGPGGQGGGGTGGDSFCYATFGTGQVSALAGCTSGTAGAGGAGGQNGSAGRSGLHN